MWVFVSKLISLSIVTTLVTIPFVKESAVARGGVSIVALKGDLGSFWGYKHLFSG